MADDELFDLVREWCEAKAKHDHENFPGGFPYYPTSHRLYHAGRALFSATGVAPSIGFYQANNHFEKPTGQCQEILDANRELVRNHGTDLPSGQSEGYYLGKKLCNQTNR
jgi:hypothetical protein